MRGRNAAHEKVAGQDGDNDCSSIGESLNSRTILTRHSSIEAYKSVTSASSKASDSPGSNSSRVGNRSASPRRLLDLYYKYVFVTFYVSTSLQKAFCFTKRILSSYLATTSYLVSRTILNSSILKEAVSPVTPAPWTSQTRHCPTRSQSALW
jgi:hypothetical protein